MAVSFHNKIAKMAVSFRKVTHNFRTHDSYSYSLLYFLNLKYQNSYLHFISLKCIFSRTVQHGHTKDFIRIPRNEIYSLFQNYITRAFSIGSIVSWRSNLLLNASHLRDPIQGRYFILLALRKNVALPKVEKP